MKATLTWAFTTWLALVALQALTTRTAPGRVADLFKDVDRLLERALDPTVPAIPDLRAGASPSSSSSSTPPASSSATTTTPRLPAIGGTAPARRGGHTRPLPHPPPHGARPAAPSPPLATRAKFRPVIPPGAHGEVNVTRTLQGR